MPEKIKAPWDLTNDQVLNNWNSKRIVWSVELGGIGPGYEQALQIALFTLFNYLNKHKIELENLVTVENEFSEQFDNICYKLWDKMGLSGAQAGTAKGTAYQFYKFGYTYMMNKAPKNRLILVSKNSPSKR